MTNNINVGDMAKRALTRVLTNLSKAVLKITCTFNWLAPGDDDLGYTYRRRIIGVKNGQNEVAEIYLNRDHKMFSQLDDTMKNVAIFGVATHEMLHQKFTNFDLFEKTAKRTQANKTNLLHTMFNIFEDSRIEFFANQVFGGKALAALKYVINLTWDEAPEIDQSAHPVFQIINALIQYGDTGKIKGDFSDDETREDFLYCCELFDKAIVSPVCKDCINLSVEATEYLFNKYATYVPQPTNNIRGGGKGEDAKQQSKGSQAANAKQQNRNATKQQQKGKQNSGNKSQQNKSNKGQGQGNEDKNGKNQNGSQNSGNEDGQGQEQQSQQGNGSQNGQQQGQGGNGNENDNSQSQNEGNGDSSSNGGGSTNPSSGGENNSSDEAMSGDTSNDNSDEEGKAVEFDDFVFEEEDIEDFADELEGKMEAATQAIAEETKLSEGGVHTFKLEDAECDECRFVEVPLDEATFHAYQQYANAVDISGYADELAKDMQVILKTRPTGWERNKSGKLNIKRYCDPNFNSPFIFDKKLSNDSSIAVSILIDESGSMSSRSRIDRVRQMASVLAEAFLQLDIKFNILGHTGGECDEYTDTIREYSDFDSNVFEQVLTIAARDYNYDGASIKVAADKLSKREERNKLMFVLTDGASHNVANTELAIRDASKFATVIGVALACGSDRDTIEKMYGQNFVMVDSMDQLMDTIVDKLKEVSCTWS